MSMAFWGCIWAQGRIVAIPVYIAVYVCELVQKGQKLGVIPAWETGCQGQVSPGEVGGLSLWS